MCIRNIALGVIALVPVAAIAHEPAEKSEWSEFEDWKLVSIANNGEAALFLSQSLTVRAGNAVQTELLTIFKQAGELGDQVNVHLLVDCSSMTHRQTHQQGFGPNGPLPPPIVRFVPQPRPAEGTAMLRALEMACGTIPMGSPSIADPYDWTRRELDRLSKR